MNIARYSSPVLNSSPVLTPSEMNRAYIDPTIVRGKRILFFFVHPSKFYLFRYAIRWLRENGAQVDIAVTSKDVLTNLLDQEGWEYHNVLPGGRRSTVLKGLLGTAFFALNTLWGLGKYLRGKHYDMFVSDDLLLVMGWLYKVPSAFFVDDDFEIVKETLPLWASASTIVAPHCTSVGRFAKKKYGYNGYHELAYLTPQYFSPDKSKIRQFHPGDEPYSIVRLVSLTASHDRGKQGISNIEVKRLLDLLHQFGKVYISSERPLVAELEPFRISVAPQDMHHALAFAQLFVGDSQTMTSEAALLGTPALRCNDFVGIVNSMEEREHKHRIMFGFKPRDFDGLLRKAEEILRNPGVKQEWSKRVAKVHEETEDMNQVILDVIAKHLSPNYLRSVL